MNDFKIRPRSEVEELVTKFIVDNKIHAQYGKDTEGLFIVQFLVQENEDEIEILKHNVRDLQEQLPAAHIRIKRLTEESNANQ